MLKRQPAVIGFEALRPLALRPCFSASLPLLMASLYQPHYVLSSTFEIFFKKFFSNLVNKPFSIPQKSAILLND